VTCGVGAVAQVVFARLAQGLVAQAGLAGTGDLPAPVLLMG